MTRSTITQIVIAGLAAAAVAGPSAAQDIHVRRVYSPDATHIVHAAAVDYADLDLSTGSGRAALMDRIGGAAAAVCRTSSGSDDELRPIRDCVRQAISDAVRDVDSRELSAAAQGRRATFLAEKTGVAVDAVATDR